MWGIWLRLILQVNFSVSNKDAKSTGHLILHIVAQYSVFVVIQLMDPVSHSVYEYFKKTWANVSCCFTSDYNIRSTNLLYRILLYAYISLVNSDLHLRVRLDYVSRWSTFHLYVVLVACHLYFQGSFCTIAGGKRSCSKLKRISLQRKWLHC